MEKIRPGAETAGRSDAAGTRSPLPGPRAPDSLIKILDELVAVGGLVREVDPGTGMTVYREPSK